jgi:hypothetical protein
MAYAGILVELEFSVDLDCIECMLRDLNVVVGDKIDSLTDMRL